MAELSVADKAAETAALPADKAEPRRAQTDAWVVTLDAFSDVKNVAQLKTRLSEAGVKSYTEPVKTSKGELTRVRAGPFASKEAAETARAKLDALGLKPGAITSR
jgi:DedD protein